MTQSTWVHISIYVPMGNAEAVRTALAEAGAGRLGNYQGASWSTTGVGRFTPMEGATPAIGAVGVAADVPEHKIEVLAPREIARSVLEAAIAAHPYEEPAYYVTEALMIEDL
ncbi:MAG: hypothetical protein ACTHWM_05240 [Yaniella sp.]|uniref:hypothetical protein n=1 Tax=Yaniella sp. TaxID=2773929 RepID=UPI003F944615